MKFNIILEDGGVILNCIVLVSRGLAESKRDIHINMKYQGGICICNKRYRNYWIKTEDIYDIEEVKLKAVNENPKQEEDLLKKDIEK